MTAIETVTQEIIDTANKLMKGQAFIGPNAAMCISKIDWDTAVGMAIEIKRLSLRDAPIAVLPLAIPKVARCSRNERDTNISDLDGHEL
jgi:hypothetical protein